MRNNGSTTSASMAVDDKVFSAVRLSRRHLLGAAAATTALAATNRLAIAADGKSDGYIDAHVHVWTPDTNKYPLDKAYDKSSMQPASFTPEQLMAHAKPAGVNRIVLIQMSFYGVDNSYMLDVMAAHPGRFSGVAVIDPADKPRQTMRQLKSQGVRGFRIVAGKQPADQWLDNPTMHKMWSIAADEGLAICPLMNPEYLPAVDAMCAKYPKTRVVVDHFARIGVDGKIQDAQVEALCRLARHENAYLKASAFYALGKKQAPYTDLGPMIHRCMDAYGSQRMMWASDCPYQVEEGHTYQESIDLIREKLDFLSDQDRAWMLGKTAEKVFWS
ncbi:4-sulfomuconolactone hydrolase [Rosistilla carotiformis]|uniref:4-sulfomuconolactone hydrolase n=2 Tax=Rosistilla carotiformis TaxID=2528017 RepID=A0A518JLK1_9BACT|nr:4-sulfomuconolactone hydrolase [Rosistilla carotiformis]